MKRYGVTLTEETEYYVEVEAESEREARDLAMRVHDAGGSEAVGASNPTFYDMEEVEE